MLEEKIRLDMLSQESVTVVKQQFYNNQPVGDIWRRTYNNDTLGIELIKQDLQEPYLSSIFKMWNIE